MGRRRDSAAADILMVGCWVVGLDVRCVMFVVLMCIMSVYLTMMREAVLRLQVRGVATVYVHLEVARGSFLLYICEEILLHYSSKGL